MTKLIAMTNDQLTIISNNTNGMQKRQKRLKIIEYLKTKLSRSGLLFLQETHSQAGDEIKWKDDSLLRI